ncbi:MAG: prolyl oligopeptidase family serine peptidase, partial [Bacteroidota bacterium]|nr:prolyl oligopeptidase family serine peptidase [Bacteroidota bacterium]
FEEDSTILDDEKVKVDIWSWKDDLIQPMQLKNKSRELERGFWASVDNKVKRLTPLENENLEIAGFDLDHLTEWLPAYDETPYRKRLSWDYPTYNDLYVVSSRTGKARKITERVQARPQVSPGGKYVYWYDNVLQQWKIQDIDGGEIRVLSMKIPHPVYDVENDIPAPAYPYGISGWAQKDRFVLVYDRFDIWKVDPSNLKAVPLTHGRDENGKTQYRRVDLDREDPFLKKDKWLLLGFNEGTKEQRLVWMDPNNGDMTLWDQGEIRYRTILKVKDEDVFVIRKENFVSYPEIYVASGPKEVLKKLSITNPQQAEFNWGTAEKVTWTAFDGTPLEGLLYKPEDFDPNKKYPMIVYFYETYSDNLHVHYTPRPSASVINFPLFVSNGYLIFVPDIVYKVGEPGPSAYNCIVSGTREMMRHSWVDSTRIGIQGQSWGGYQVAYLVTQTDLYAAAMAGAPVSNMLSAYGGIRWGSGMSREFQYEKTQSRLGTTPWENLDVYLENSPVVYADQVNTPLLIMHNDNDGAVPWYQGIEYFMALRRLHKPAWMLVYNNEEHNLMLDHNRKDLSRRMSQFFDHYLKDAPTPEWMDEGVPATEKGKNYGFEYLSKPSEE